MEDSGWFDLHDEHAEHWAFADEGGVVASARLCVHEQLGLGPDCETVATYSPLFPGPVAFLNRLVVSPTHAGRGLSRRLDAARIGFARSAGCLCIAATTHGMRERSLASLGFTQVGPVTYGPKHPLAGIQRRYEIHLWMLRLS